MDEIGGAIIFVFLCVFVYVFIKAATAPMIVESCYITHEPREGGNSRMVLVGSVQWKPDIIISRDVKTILEAKELASQYGCELK